MPCLILLVQGQFHIRKEQLPSQSRIILILFVNLQLQLKKDFLLLYLHNYNTYSVEEVSFFFNVDAMSAAINVLLQVISSSLLSSPLLAAVMDYSEHRSQFRTSLYKEILEELNGAHLRFAASHVSQLTNKQQFLFYW